VSAKKTSDLLRAIEDLRGSIMHAKRVYREDLDCRTPARSASSAGLQAVKGIAARVGSILEEKEKP